MDNEEIDDYDDLRDVMSDHRAGDRIWVGYIRNDKPSRVLVTLGQRGVPMYSDQGQEREWTDARDNRAQQEAAEYARAQAQADRERARAERERASEREQYERERERIARERERLEREQERLREEQERLARERERMSREAEARDRDRDYNRDREFTRTPSRNDNRDLAFSPRNSARGNGELGVADRLIQEIEGRRTDDHVLRSYIENPTLSIRDFEVFPNPNQGRFRLAFETQDRGEIRIYILNNKGEQVYQEVLVNFLGRYDSDIDMTRRISPGTYYIMLVQDERVMVEPLEVN